VAEIKVVASAEPFHRTCDPFWKAVPVAVTVKAGPPAGAVLGARLVNVRATGAMVKGRLFDSGPLGLAARIDTGKILAKRAAGTTAVN
jgi:hypothetical protein